MRMITYAASLAVTAGCAFALLQAAIIGEEVVVTSKPILVLSGADSHMDQPAFHRVASQKAWNSLWLFHLGKTESDQFREHLPIVTIDFEKNIVIAIFRGAATNSRGLQIVSVDEARDDITLHFDDMSYQTVGGLGDGGGSVHVTPYAFVVVPKSSKDFVLKEDVQRLKDKPPEWKERGRLTDIDSHR